MADSRHHFNAVHCRHAVALLLGGALLHYGWAFAPPEHQAQVWNICGALVRLGLLGVVLWRVRGIALWIGAWWAAEEVLVVGCSSWYIVAPWEVLPGQAQCSALLGYDLGGVGIAVVAVLALSLSLRT